MEREGVRISLADAKQLGEVRRPVRAVEAYVTEAYLLREGAMEPVKKQGINPGVRRR